MITALAILAVSAVTALAQDPGGDAYGSDPSLPMTGFDLVLLLGGGAALLLVGVVLRRVVRPS